MPELPEVEFARRFLSRSLVERRIESIWADPGKPLRDLTPAELAVLVGCRVREVRRHGKQLFLELGDQVLLLHLGMTGKCVYLDQTERPAVRLRLDLDDGKTVGLLDARRFGRVRLLSAAAAEQHPEVKDLGPDARALAPEQWAERLERARSAIKLVLLDQRRLAGVGNIYASEGLFDAGIDPAVRADGLSARQYVRLGRAVHAAMDRTLESEAGDELHYLSEGAENRFWVYGRAGEPCRRCGAKIVRSVQGARSTFACPRCQRASRRA